MIIQTKNLTKVYESTLGVNVLAVHNVSISINRSEFVCIMGPSGSGKSTLLNLLGGLDYPTSGMIAVGGVNYADLTEEQLTVFR
ncbi:MAG: ATP-binding cassette domain-containing protein, partial [Actinobacteria bacterium]|nr:ATP-binding cassette domain-containing protein [Actinomycetota bacterium]